MKEADEGTKPAVVVVSGDILLISTTRRDEAPEKEGRREREGGGESTGIVSLRLMSKKVKRSLPLWR